jgi:hypothetical protein
MLSFSALVLQAWLFFLTLRMVTVRWERLCIASGDRKIILSPEAPAHEQGRFIFFPARPATSASEGGTVATDPARPHAAGRTYGSSPCLPTATTSHWLSSTARDRRLPPPRPQPATLLPATSLYSWPRRRHPTPSNLGPESKAQTSRTSILGRSKRRRRRKREEEEAYLGQFRLMS